MSGIFAIISDISSEIENPEVLGESMLKGLKVYGGADSGYKIASMARRQIICGSCVADMHAGTVCGQPVIETGRHIAVCDAIIFNRAEVLKAVSADDDMSDGELLVCVYEKMGGRGLLHVNGDFAAVLIDKKDGAVRLLRDHIGVRPLYYVQTGDCLTVSTDYRPMLHLPYIKAEINENMMYDTMTMGSMASETDTVFANVNKAVHGSVTYFVHPGVPEDLYRFYIPGRRKAKEQMADEEYYAEAAKLLRNAVRIRYEAVTGKKSGCEFSGGLDSGMVTALLAELCNERGEEKPIVLTWSPSLADYEMRHSDDEPVRDEREVISRFCEEKGLTCVFRNEREATDEEKILSRGAREEICEYDTGIIADTMEAFASNNVKVVWSGWGGDEGISMRFSPYHLAQTGDLAAYMKAAKFAAHGSPKKYLGFVKRSVRFVHRAKKPWNGMEANDLTFNVVQPAFAEKMRHGYVPKMKYFGTSPERNMLSGTLESRLLLCASAGADAGVMYLFPLLDPRVLDFALTVPRRLYLDGDRRRVLPQRALSDILPDYLTTFAGTSNVEKEDTGRMDFYTEIEEKSYEILDKFYLDHIDRIFFEDYIDFGVMEETISEENDPLTRTILRNMLRVLYKMQLLMK